MIRYSFGMRVSFGSDEIDWAKLILHIALWFNLAAIGFKLLGYWVYIYITGI